MSLRCRRCPACFAPSSWRLWISWRRSRRLSGSPASGTTSVPWACPSWTSGPASRSTRSEAQWAWPLLWPTGRVWATSKRCQRMWREGWRGRRGYRGCGACLTSDTKEPAAVRLSDIRLFMGQWWWDVSDAELRTLCWSMSTLHQTRQDESYHRPTLFCMKPISI